MDPRDDVLVLHAEPAENPLSVETILDTSAAAPVYHGPRLHVVEHLARAGEHPVHHQVELPRAMPRNDQPLRSFPSFLSQSILSEESVIKTRQGERQEVDYEPVGGQ